MKKYKPLLPRLRLLALKELILDLESTGKARLSYSNSARIQRVLVFVKTGHVKLVKALLKLGALRDEIDHSKSSLQSLAYASLPPNTRPLLEGGKVYGTQLRRKIDVYKELLSKVEKNWNHEFTSQEVADLEYEMFEYLEIDISKEKIAEWKKELQAYADAYIEGILVDNRMKWKEVLSYVTHKTFLVRKIVNALSKQAPNNVLLDEKALNGDRADLLFLEPLLALEREGMITIQDIGCLEDELLAKSQLERKLIATSRRTDWMWMRFSILKPLGKYFAEVELPAIQREFPNYELPQVVANLLGVESSRGTNRHNDKSISNVKNMARIKPQEIVTYTKKMGDVELNDTLDCKIAGKEQKWEVLSADEKKAVIALDVFISLDSSIEQSFAGYEEFGRQHRKIASGKLKRVRKVEKFHQYGITVASKTRNFLKKMGSKLQISKELPLKIIAE